MLSISEPQMSGLDQQDRDRFIANMKVHISEYFPDHFEALGDENTYELVELAIQKADKHLIYAERDVCKFTNLMLSFGIDFDQDPECSWARDVLDDPMQNFGPKKINALYDAAMAFLEEKAQREGL